MEKTNYFNKNDSLVVKGVGIILMICYHLFRDEKQCFNGKTVDFFPFSFDTGIAINDGFRICVGLFVFVTGFGLYKSFSGLMSKQGSVVKWTANRLLKTMSGFYFVYLLFVPAFQLYNKFPEYIYSRAEETPGIIYAIIDFLGLSNLFSTPSLQGAWWYMSAAILFVVFMPVLYKLTDKFGFFAITFVIVILTRVLDLGYLTGCNAYTFLPILLAGMFFAKYDVFGKMEQNNPFKKNGLTKVSEFILIAALVLGSALFADRIPKNKFWELHFFIVPLFAIVFITRYVSKVPIVNKVLAFLGKHSMNMFLVHSFIRVNYFYDFTYSFKYAFVIAVVLILFSLAVSIVIELIKKLIRYDKFINFLLRKMNESNAFLTRFQPTQ